MSSALDVKDQVLTELRLRKIKLWLSPYHSNIRGSSGAALQVLENLAADLAAGVIDATTTEILESLILLQQHALEKLNQKIKATCAPPSAIIECLELKVLGLQHSHLKKVVESASSVPIWAEQVEVSGKGLKIFHVDSSLTFDNFCGGLVTLLETDSLRLIYKGRSIVAGDHRRLYDVIQHDKSGSNHHDKTVVMICLAFHKKDGENADRTLVSSIRQAATKLGAATAFDVTDQHGKHVSMLPTDRLAFLTALGLHRLGRKRMEESNLPSALALLMEADFEWSKVTPQWLNAADNYGLLQLDIAWVYLKLESIENLPDVVRRLDIAEKTLRNQVDSNFVTLALVQAEMGNAVPPLASIFCRLFLVQGVAYRLSNDIEKSRERLDWAFGLCQSLRSVSPTEQVNSLCDALQITPFEAISALRRTNGILDQAASLVETEKADGELQRLRREQQTTLGLCENTVDHVDLDLVVSLGGVLGFDGLQAPTGSQDMDSDFLLVAGLLRLSNNNIEEAIDIFQRAGRSPHVVHRYVSDLDTKQVGQGFAKAKRGHRKTQGEVDEFALATLLSMGVEESFAKQALQHSQNNAERAMIWMTEHAEEDLNVCGSSALSNSKSAETDENEGALAKQSQDDLNSSGSSSLSNSSKSGEMDESEGSLAKRARVEREEVDEAEQLLKKELGEALRDRDLEQEYFGSTLDEEWEFINRFRA